MAITNGYLTVEELQIAIDNTGQARFQAADVILQEIAIEAASRWIDEYTHSRFYGTSETRYYTADNYNRLYLPDDLTSITTLKTDDDDDGTYETTWTTSDYILKPRNAALDGEPYRYIDVDWNSSNSFPVNVQDGIEIVGAFGYSSGVSNVAPAPVKQACLILAHRLWKRKDSIFGVAGTAALGVTTVQSRITQDADIMQMLSGVARRGGWVNEYLYRHEFGDEPANKARRTARNTPSKTDKTVKAHAQMMRFLLKKEPYPPKLKNPNQRYKRTGNLANSWGVRRLRSARYTVRNSADYAVEVVGTTEQKKPIHKNPTRSERGSKPWYVAVDVVRRYNKRLTLRLTADILSEF